jgi:hypothetical protein
MKALTGLVNIGFLGKAKASNLFSWLESQESTQEKPNSNNYLPSMYGFAHGSKNGVPASVGVCIMNDDRSSADIGMGEITGIPLACGIKMLAEGKINEVGVYQSSLIFRPLTLKKILGLHDLGHRSNGCGRTITSHQRLKRTLSFVAVFLHMFCNSFVIAVHKMI